MSPKILLILADLALIVCVFAGLGWRAHRQNRLRIEARERNAAFLGNGEEFDVGLLQSSDLERPTTALRAVQPGTLVVGINGARFAGTAPASKRKILVEFDAATRVTMIPRPWYSVGIPAMVRLSTASGCFYLFARHKLARANAAKTALLYQALSTRLRAETRKIPDHKASPLVYAMVAIVLVAIVGAAVSSIVKPLHSGPWAIAASDNAGVIAATQQEILRFDGAGKLVQQIPFAAFGLAHAPAFLTFAPDDELYAADTVAGTIYRCGKPAKLACSALPVAFPAATRPQNAFKFAFNRDGSRIIVSIADQDTLLVLDPDGRILGSLDGTQSGLCFPNGVTFGADGNIYVADTNNFRIAEFALAQDSLRYVGEQSMAAERPASHGQECRGAQARRYLPLHDPVALAGARNGRAWPITIAQAANGNWWVVLATDTLDGADVAEFSPDWTSPTLYPLSGRHDLTTLAAWHSAIWAADTRLGIKIMQSGKQPRTLADDGLKTFMQQVRADRLRVKFRRAAGLFGSAAILMIVLLSAALANRRYIARVLRTEPETTKS